MLVGTTAVGSFAAEGSPYAFEVSQDIRDVEVGLGDDVGLGVGNAA